MPIMRNPFRKQDENVRPVTERNASSEEIKEIDDKHKNLVEYQLSEINDSGVYLPPSPMERKSFWGTTSSRSTTSSSINRCAFNENEPFNISRESFDSYRRSFDISARSPVIRPESQQRMSLDNRTFLPPTRASLSSSSGRPVQVPQTQQEEDRFEDINIDDYHKPAAPPKKRGILSRIVDSGNDHDSSAAARPTSSNDNKSAWHHFGSGRKRGQSGQGAELGSIPRSEATPKPEKQQAKQIAAAAPPPVQAPPPPIVRVQAPSTPVNGIETPPAPRMESTRSQGIKVDS